MTRSTRVALRDPREVSTIPLTNPPLEHRTNFSRASTESQATKPSRRWQPSRVTSTTVLQLYHLVLLDATSRCNALESHSLAIGLSLLSTSELEGSQSHLHKPPRLKGAQQPAQGRAPPLFIAPKTNRAIGAFGLRSARAPDMVVRAPDKVGRCPTVEFQWLVQTRR